MALYPVHAVFCQQLNGLSQAHRADVVAISADFEHRRIRRNPIAVKGMAPGIFQIGQIVRILVRNLNIKIGIIRRLQVLEVLFLDIQKAHTKGIAQPFFTAGAVEIHIYVFDIHPKRTDLLNTVYNIIAAVFLCQLADFLDICPETVDLLHSSQQNNPGILIDILPKIICGHTAVGRFDLPQFKPDLIHPGSPANCGCLIFQIANQDIISFFQRNAVYQNTKRVRGALYQRDLFCFAVQKGGNRLSRRHQGVSLGTGYIAGRDRSITKHIGKFVCC